MPKLIALIQMSYRRRVPNHGATGDHVRGPNLALTAFLREHGITDDLIRRRQARQHVEDVEEVQEAEPGEESDSELEIRIAARRKRRAAKENASDYTDSGLDGEPELSVGPGQPTACESCDGKFTITSFTKRGKEGGYLCATCAAQEIEKNKAAYKKNLAARKRRKKLAAALLDRQELSFPTLQDFCIRVIVANLDHIEELGDIGARNLDKISKIICKNRALTDASIPLFLGPDTKSLRLWDCAKVTKSGLMQIGAYCPNLESLSLQYAAALDNQVLDYFAEKLGHLTSLELNGSFLMNDETWCGFLTRVGPQLTSLKITNSNRFGDQSIAHLVTHCRKLESLKLSRLDNVLDKKLYLRLQELSPCLKLLEISYPTNETLVDDVTVVLILESLGFSLESLNLDGCSALGDEFLTVGIKQYCPELKNLSLQYLDQITDTGIKDLFTEWGSNQGLFLVDLLKCVMVGDLGLQALLTHLGTSLVELNINSVSITYDTIEFLAGKTLPLLTTLDCGFCRCIDNSAMKVFEQVCPKLKLIEVFGNNRVRGGNFRRGLQVIGRQSDSI